MFIHYHGSFPAVKKFLELLDRCLRQRIKKISLPGSSPDIPTVILVQAAGEARIRLLICLEPGYRGRFRQSREISGRPGLATCD